MLIATLAALFLLNVILGARMLVLGRDVEDLRGDSASVRARLRIIENKTDSMYIAVSEQEKKFNLKTYFIPTTLKMHELVTEPLYALMKQLGYKWEPSVQSVLLPGKLVKVKK